MGRQAFYTLGSSKGETRRDATSFTMLFWISVTVQCGALFMVYLNGFRAHIKGDDKSGKRRSAGGVSMEKSRELRS